MTVDDIRMEREAREAVAQAVAATLPHAHYYAADNEVRDETTHAIVHTAPPHWDAVLVMTAAHGRMIDADTATDAYGRTGVISDCMSCSGAGIDYGETCVGCGGFGWVREMGIES